MAEASANSFLQSAEQSSTLQSNVLSHVKYKSNDSTSEIDTHEMQSYPTHVTTMPTSLPNVEANQDPNIAVPTMNSSAVTLQTGHVTLDQGQTEEVPVSGMPVHIANSDVNPVQISSGQVVYVVQSGQDSRVPTKASKKAFVPEGVVVAPQKGVMVLTQLPTDASGQLVLQHSSGAGGQQQFVIQQTSETSNVSNGQLQQLESDTTVHIPENAEVEEIGAEELEREFQNQSTQKSHQCHTCGETFFMYLELLRHVMSAHSNALPTGQKGDHQEGNSQESQDTEVTIYECSECKLRFNKVAHLNEHIAMHFAVKAGTVQQETEPEPEVEEEQEDSVKPSKREQDKKFACDQCGKRFTRSFSLKNHMLLHEGVKPFECQVCSKTFREMTKLKNHMAVHADAKPHICAICAKAFAAAAYLRTHMMIHTGKKPYKCTQCDMAFISSGNLKRHLRVHTGEKPFKCDFCGAAFAQMGNLESHKRTHTGVRPYECEICGKGFMQSSGLVEHIRTHSGAKPYTCDVCGRSFAGSSGLRVHKRTHTGEKPHECDICLRRFAASGNLKTHMKIHMNLRPFKCEYCGKGFVASGNLSQHVRIHTGEKPYKCNICEKAFAGTGGLKIHMMGHYDEKPFMCEFCDKGFKTKQKLVAHTRSHTGERPFVCSVCQKSFTLGEKLKAHVRKKHVYATSNKQASKAPVAATREPADYEDLGPPVLSPQPLEPIPRIPPSRPKTVPRSSPRRSAKPNSDSASEDPYDFEDSSGSTKVGSAPSSATPMETS